MYNISEYLKNEARQKVYRAVTEYNEGRGISGMYKLLIGDIGWRVEYQDRGHHEEKVIEAIHNLYAEDPDSKVDVIFKETLENLFVNACTVEEYVGVHGVVIDELEKELKMTNSFTVDADDMVKKYGDLVTRKYDIFKSEFKNINADFDESFFKTQLYFLERFGLFIEAEQFKGMGQLNFLYWYIGGDIEFSNLSEEDLRRMLIDYRESLPNDRSEKLRIEQKVSHACDSYLSGDKIPLRNLLLGIGEGDMTYFAGGGHNYRIIIELMHSIYCENKESRMNEVLENCLIELICEVRSAYYIKLLVNTAMYEMAIENTEYGNFKINIEEITEYFIENIAKNHDQYIMESPDFDKWLIKKPVAREKTPKEQALINAKKAKEQIEYEVSLLRAYVGWDKEFDEMSEKDRFELHSRYMTELSTYEAMIPNLTLKVSEAVQKYRNGDKEQLIELLRGRKSGKVEFIRGTGHAYRVIIDIMHDIYKSDNSCGVEACLYECLYFMAEVMPTIRDIEEMMDLMIYEIEKEQKQTASFEINSKKISVAMRRNTEDDKEKYFSQVSDFNDFLWKLISRAEKICGDDIL